MASGGQQDLANMLPGPRFQQDQTPQRARMPSFSPGPPSPLDDEAVAQQREARQERRRMKQASPGEGRNARPSGTGEPDTGLASPTRSTTPTQFQAASRGNSDTDMTRFGLAAETSDIPSPVPRAQRRRMPSIDAQGAETARTPSEYGSDAGSPLHRMSRTDITSTRDSLESVTAGGARRDRKGSGARKVKVKRPETPVKIPVADIHIVGEIAGATGFSYPMLFCRWQLLYEPSKSWKVVRGKEKGATHACCSAVPELNQVVWDHPLDIHMQTQSLQGWPALLLHVFARDEGNHRNTFVSYALVNLPTSPGVHCMSTQTWYAVESNRALGRSFFGWFTGLVPRLEDETFITDLRKREDAGPFICTVGAGEVHLRLNILTRNLDQVSHQGGESLATALERVNLNIRRSAAMEERRRSQDSTTLTEGQKQIRGGREERLSSAKAALDARSRQGGGLSPQPSDISRTPSFLGNRSSFRGFSGVRGSMSPRPMGSEAGAADDSRSELSYAGGRPRTQRERIEALKQREAARKAAAEAKAAEAAAKAEAEAKAQEGEEGAPSGEASGTVAGDGAAGTTAPPSRAASTGVGGGASRPAGDDGLETIDAGEVPRRGPVAEGDVTAARAAERLARRARMRSAF